jgi:hypothetical protein
MKNLRIRNKRIIKLLVLMLSAILILQACEPTFSDTFIEVPESNFEVIAELPSFKSTYPDYIRWNFIQLEENSEGLVLVREIEGFGNSCFLLELYDIKKKEIIRNVFLGTSEELREKHSSIITISDLVVDSENKLYIGLKNEIFVFSNELRLLNILSIPELKSYNIDFPNILFAKENKLFILCFGKVISVDKNTGEVIDNININKNDYPEITNLGTHGITNYKESSIAIYYADYILRKEKEWKKVLFTYNINTQTVENKFIFSKDNNLFSDENYSCFHVDSCYPYITIWVEDSDYNTYMFICNPESEWINLLKLGRLYTPDINRGRTRKEGNKYYYYLQIRDFNMQRDVVIRINLTEYLK